MQLRLPPRLQGYPMFGAKQGWANLAGASCVVPSFLQTAFAAWHCLDGQHWQTQLKRLSIPHHVSATL